MKGSVRKRKNNAWSYRIDLYLLAKNDAAFPDKKE